MTDFNVAFDKTMGIEGGYSNDPQDVGGETYRGIARNYHPTWEGWKIIDKYRSAGMENWTSSCFKTLDPYVREFYRDTFWKPMLLDSLPQLIANEMFDTGVNMGISRAVTFLQRSLNALNRNQELFADLVEDGQMGRKSWFAVWALTPSDHDVLVLFMNVCQGQHYMDYMKKSPTQEKYARGWAKRVRLEKGAA